LSGRFLNPNQAASGDEDLAVALGGGQAGCGVTEPGGGVGDESDRMFHKWLLTETGRQKRKNERGQSQQSAFANYLVLYW